MKFPYGICDFYEIITGGYLYADRTDRIPIIEDAGKHLLFLRPRRFGKSLLLSMLENYYDVAKADEFEKLFGHLAVGKNPTQWHNRYFVMKWDFSAVDPQGDSQQISRALHNHINGCIERFISDYRKILVYPVVTDTDNALRSFQSVLTAVSQTPYKLYLLIDEYDNFANEVMMGGHAVSHKQRYEDLLYGEGSLKTVFKAVKSASAGRGLDRVFITGVSPVVLSDITSGYNIAKNIYLKPQFNDLCGFQESEIQDMLRRISSECGLPVRQADETLCMMRTFYNGYCFTYDRSQPVYNPTLSLWFTEYFQECRYPQQMLDSNLAMDRGKLVYISRLPEGGKIIISALNGEPSLSVQGLADRFGVEDMLTAPKDNTFMASLLYYFGVLTFSGTKTDMGGSVLKIPNLVIRKLYAERIREMFLPDITGDEVRQIAGNFYRTGDMQPLCDFIEQKYFGVFDNRDYRWANELVIKTAFLTLLFDDNLYIMDSETSLERSYADLTMIIRPDMRQYPISDFLMEFKYVSLKDAGFGGEQVKQISGDELKVCPIIQQKVKESESKLVSYRKTLLSEYGARLRLRTYSVVSVGFERLIWEELNSE